MPAVLAMHNFALRTPDWQQAQPGSFQQLMSDISKRAREGMDPRDWASQLRAMMAQDVSRPFGGSMEKAPALVVLASQDHMVHPGPAREFARLAKLDVLELTGYCGHMATSCESGKMTPAVQAFLARQ